MTEVGVVTAKETLKAVKAALHSQYMSPEKHTLTEICAYLKFYLLINKIYHNEKR